MQKEQLYQFFDAAVTAKASDIHISVDCPLIYRLNGRITPYNTIPLNASDLEEIVGYLVPEEKQAVLKKEGEADFSCHLENGTRFRVNVYRERGQYAIAMRIVKSIVPDAADYNLPTVVSDFAKLQRGLVLVTGPTGSGKTTTLAAIINEINKNRSAHIITLEDPIEFIHQNQKSIINQREIGSDSINYASALRSALRQDPDVILIGEMRDFETISTVMTTAETGHLVFSTLHTTGVGKSINRIIDVFPPHQQNQIRMQLASILEGVVSMQLVPHISGNSLVAAYEIMKATPAIRNLIREGKNYQIISQMQTGKQLGMQTMDGCLLNLVREQQISKESALTYCIDKESMQRDLANIR